MPKEAAATNTKKGRFKKAFIEWTWEMNQQRTSIWIDATASFREKKRTKIRCLDVSEYFELKINVTINFALQRTTRLIYFAKR